MTFPYTVVVTGTIASGKSTATNYFKQQGIEVIRADDIARQLTTTGTPALEAISAHFGTSMLNNDGTLNRRALRNIIVAHPDERKWLEDYLHPQIRTQLEAEMANVKSPYVIIEIPLLRRREDFPYINQVLLLEVNQATQIQRLMARDACTETEAVSMINIQPCQTVRRALADDVIQNNSDEARFESLLHALHERYLKAAQAA